MSSLSLSVSLEFTLWVVQTSSTLITHTLPPGTWGQVDTPMYTAHSHMYRRGAHVDKHTHRDIQETRHHHTQRHVCAQTPRAHMGKNTLDIPQTHY